MSRVLRQADPGLGLLDLARTLAGRGLAVVTYDGRGQGNSEGARRGQEETTEDLESVLDVIRRRRGIDADRVGLFGQCVGGAGALRVASRSVQVRAVAVWGTLPSYSEALRDDRLNGILAESYDRYVTRAQHSGEEPVSKASFLETFSLVDCEAELPEIRQPVLVCFGSADKMFGRSEEQERIFNGLTASRCRMLTCVGGQSHRLLPDLPSFSGFAQMLAGFFLEYV